MKTILTVGVYDLIHIGHVNLFRKAKELSEGGKLIVAVQDSDVVLKYKPEAKLVYSTEERMYMVKAIRYVDEVKVYQGVDEVVKTKRMEELRTEWFEDYEDGKFENTAFRISTRYVDILKSIYGDYMKMPPEEKRHGYHTATFYWR